MRFCCVHYIIYNYRMVSSLLTISHANPMAATSNTLTPAESLRPSKRTRFSSESQPAGGRLLRHDAQDRRPLSPSPQTWPESEGCSSSSQLSGLSYKTKGNTLPEDRVCVGPDRTPNDPEEPRSEAVHEPPASRTDADHHQGEQSLTPVADTRSQDHQKTVETSQDDLEISQYDIWSDYDQEELDALDELETTHNIHTSQLTAPDAAIPDPANPISPAPVASNQPIAEADSKRIASPNHHHSSAQLINPNIPCSSPHLPSDASPSSSSRLKRNVSSLFSTGAGQPFPMTMDQPDTSPCFPHALLAAEPPSASIASNTVDLAAQNPLDAPRMIRPNQPVASQPRRASSSLFQTGAGQPFPMDMGGGDFQNPSSNVGNPACPVFGFQTARGDAVTAPSKEAMRKALNICSNTNLSPFPKPHYKEPESPSPSHRANILNASQLRSSRSASPGNVGTHQLGDDKSQPDHSALLAPTRTPQNQEAASTDSSSMDPPIKPLNSFKPSVGLFSTGSGDPIHIPVSAVERARAHLDNPSRSLELQDRLTNGSCAPLKDVSNLWPSPHTNHKMAATADLLAGSSSRQPHHTISSKLHESRSTVAPAIPSQPTTAASLMSTPVRALSNGVSRPNPQNSPHQRIPLPSCPHTTTAPVRRISNRIHIGLTPQSASRRVSQEGKVTDSRSFITPFKKKMDVAQANSLFSPAHDSPHPYQAQETPSSDPCRRSVMYMDPPTSLARYGSSGRPQSVFDLSKRSSVRRVPMADWLASPKGYSARHLLSLAVPESVVFMNAKSAAIWSFNALTEPFGAIQALGELLQAGCVIGRSTPKWVANHWGLVIWKLAGMVRWQPDCLPRVWNPANVVQQLKYRYEREFVCCHRPALKKILDNECPASMPMCLVIVGIIRPPKHSSPLKGSAPASEILELSDGWYKIKAHLDPVLVRVLKRGALRVGFKLAISGACTEAPAASQPKAQQMGQKKTTAKGPSDEGAEEEEVRLYLEGNGTSRVRWAETLGLRPRPWVATLPSLTPDGGKIPLMDILVVKVFPPSFVDQEGRMGRWELAQEKKLQVAWEKEREKEAAKIALEQEKEGEKIMQVADLVASIYSSKCAEHRRVSSGDRKGGDGEEGSGFDADELCEDVIEGDVLPNELQALPVDRLAQLRQAVQRRYESFRSTGAEELQKTLNMRVPIRRTRNTQVLSFRDFHHSSSKHSSRPPLVGQISVQDLSRLPEDFFKAGVRYWVENLQPQRNVRWESSSSHSHSTSRIGSCEVPLTTRRDTRWTVISLDA